MSDTGLPEKNERNQLPLISDRPSALPVTLPVMEIEEFDEAMKELAPQPWESASFDFDKWKRDTLDGLNSMKQERTMLQESVQRITARIAMLDQNIEKVLAASEALGLQSEETNDDGDSELELPWTSKRESFIKRDLSNIVMTDARFHKWLDFNSIASILAESRPGVKESSVRSAIARLIRDKILIQIPSPDSSIRIPYDERRWKANQGEVQQDPKVDGSKVIERITSLLKQKPNGITGKDLAWLATDMGVEVERISEIINAKMAEGVLETAIENGQDILRFKALPGSKEELKQTKIEDRPLFPNMDRPDHA